MELAKLQDEFKDYLGSLNTANNTQTEETGEVSNEVSEEASEENDEKKYDLDNKNISVFSYADEFDQFLNEKYKDDIDDAKMKTDDLLNLKFEDGKFIEEEKKTDSEITDNAASTEEKNDEDTSDAKLPLVGILNDLMTDEKMKSIIDSDGNGEINKSEAKAFLKAIEDLDGNSGDISIKDILAGTKKIQELDLSEYQDEDTDGDDSSTDGASSAAGASDAGTSGVSGYSPAYGSGGVSATSASPSSAQSVSETSNTADEGESIEDLEKQKTEKENDVKTALEAFNQVYTGENTNVKAAQNKYDTSKADYEKLLQKEENLTAEQKKQLEDAIKKVEEKTKAVDQAQIKLQEAETALTTQQGIIAQDESNLGALKDALKAIKGQKGDDSDTKSEIKSKTSELNSKISAAEKQLNNDKAKLKELTKTRDKAKSELDTKQKDLEKAQGEKTKLETELIVNNEKVSQELKSALTTFNEAEKNVQTVKDSEAETAKGAIDKSQGELREINNKISEKKAEKTKEDNSVSSFNFNFKENLSSQQKADLESFKANFKKNKAKYDEVAKKTGMPAELIAALHWRESGGDFSTYLHNGEKLGKTTTMVPEGIYFGANQWTEAAVDAIKRQGTSGVDKKNLKSLLDFAERYNGLGYRNKGVASPYVWAGTTNYKGGKYVADGVYDANYVDQQLGVAVMMKAIS